MTSTTARLSRRVSPRPANAGLGFDQWFHSYGGYLVGFTLLFASWYVASVYLVNSALFPPPHLAALRGWELLVDGTLLQNVGISLQRILAGFLIGSALGIPIGLLMGNFRVFRVLFEPFSEFLRFIPSVAMITVAVIWFGIGEASKVFLIVYACIFIVIINTAAGVSSIAKDKIRAARSLGANTMQVFFLVSFPATVPFIMTGMRIAMQNAFTTIVAAELIAANAGIGKMLWDARLFMLVDDIFVSLLALGVLGFTLDRLFRWASVKFGGRYSPVS